MSRPVRVFQLIKGLGRGGAETLLVEGQRRSDPQRVTYGYGYLLPWKDAFAGQLTASGAEVTCFRAAGPAGLLTAVPRVARHPRRWRADLLHRHLPLSGVVGRLAGRLAGVPVVYTEHNLQERYHPVTRWLNRRTWRLQAEVAAVSSEVAASIRRHTDPRVPIRLVLNGIPVERYLADPPAGREMRGALGIDAAAQVVGTIAVLRPQKALDDWLSAAALLHARRPETRFLIVGDGPLRDQLQARSLELGLGGAVHWPGLAGDVRPYLAAMDVFLMSSRFEGLPLALLEAMAMERPVVATAVGGIPEVVEPAGCAVLVSAGDAVALADAVTALLADPGRRRALGAAARRRVEEGFSTERRERDLERLYDDVLGRPTAEGDR